MFLIQVWTYVNPSLTEFRTAYHLGYFNTEEEAVSIAEEYCQGIHYRLKEVKPIAR